MWRLVENRLTATGLLPAARQRLLCTALTVLCCACLANICRAEPIEARVRLAWGNNTLKKQLWTGRVDVEGATLSDLQPLGIEPDESAAIRLERDSVVVAPLEKRGFDGFDVTIRADDQALLSVALQSEGAAQPTRVEFTLKELLEQPARVPLDDNDSFLLTHRSPGDKLRVRIDRRSLVFNPGESWNLQLDTDLQAELEQGPLEIELEIRSLGSEEPLWQSSRVLTSTTDATQLAFQISSPEPQGAYRLMIAARSPVGLARRFVPGQQAPPAASREVHFVVIDPLAVLPRWDDRWEQALQIDPANPTWWQRLPSWARVSQFPSMSGGSLGNVSPTVHPHETGNLVELPSATADNDPPWQAYTLPIEQPGEPYLLEIEIPQSQQQHLGVSIIEPDAAGRVVSFGRDSGVYTERSADETLQQLGVYRLLFWPRSRTPQLLLTNRHPTAPAQYGKIRLLQKPQDDPIVPAEQQGERLVAGYLATPRLIDNFGAAEVLDEASGLSVDGWSTFLDASERLVQHLREGGYNGVLLSVAADGSALYPSKLQGRSPRYDTGVLAANGQDPLRKDVLEMLLRVLDREGLRVVPTLQLATPLPRLEQLRSQGDARQTGVEWIDFQGRKWLEQNSPTGGMAAYYNPLNLDVHNELNETVRELVDRYGHHRSFAGLALQLSGAGYGVLPGLDWGFDDASVAAFTADTGIEIAGEGDQRFRQRAEQLLGEHRPAWQTWRVEKLTETYARLAETLRQHRDDLQLILTTEDLFAGAQLQKQLRRSVAEHHQLRQVLVEHGVDLEQLQKVAGVVVLDSQRLGCPNPLQRRVLDLRINSAAAQGELIPTAGQSAALFFHSNSKLRLPSFDQLSPLGPAQTYLSLSNSSLPAGAAARRHLVRTLARGDLFSLVEGGSLLPLGQQEVTRDLRRTVQQLPGPTATVRTDVQQPLVARVYHQPESTTVCLINQSAWPLQVQLPLTPAESCSWTRLSQPTVETEDQSLGAHQTTTQGKVEAEEQQWEIHLQPYDLQAWKFDSSQVRVGTPESEPQQLAKAELERRIDQIESRTNNLKIQRAYTELKNPGFESIADPLRQNPSPTGWNFRVGQVGSAKLDTSQAHSGKNSLRLEGAEGVGVAVESELLPVPETGQLLVQAFVRCENISPDAQLYVTLESEDQGRTYRRFTRLGADQLTTGKWSWYEFPVNDLPLGAENQVRLQFHLTGAAEVWIDDVGLLDVWFDDPRRVELVKRVYAARTALDQGQVVDCERLVDQYWSRYLVEYVPPVSVATRPQRPEKKPAKEPPPPGMAERLKGFVPRLWR